jgi:hypothetical protein
MILPREALDPVMLQILDINSKRARNVLRSGFMVKRFFNSEFALAVEQSVLSDGQM